ncbi:17-beta-hydroxysteroid dehydrogenase 13-like [Macrosteles quadrilineatus]|uniref:17-beta-hydroxysteroid dehydrogenase 13-like n=1 Tax=Macrosteles quadrilineatus TaxID=74068 RepID=UPI0023E0DDBC|nr:17-beta-hydroxysteroid dehydrogenase 13-like [Macrosteles quadrilineatus]
METTGLPDGLIRNPSPPSVEQRKIAYKELFLLTTQILCILPFIIHDIIMTIISKIIPPPRKSLTGQVALVTGGGRGLGRGLALGLAKEGCKIAVVDINISNARGTANDIIDEGGMAKAYECNVADPAAIRVLREAVTSDLGPVDILVNNAGILYGGDLLEKCDEADIKAVIDVNLLSHFWMLKEFLPSMKERNSGHIVAIASMASFVGDSAGSAYIASKFGVRAPPAGPCSSVHTTIFTHTTDPLIKYTGLLKQQHSIGLMKVVHSEVKFKHNINTTTVYPYFINTSADYVNEWKLRVPAIPIEDVVGATIAGVQRNQVSIFVPSSFEYSVKLLDLLPVRSLERMKKVVDVQIKPHKKEKKS